MKKILLFILLLTVYTCQIFCQVPQGFKYQAVIRDNSGNSITSKVVGMRISLIQDSISGNIAYSESHVVQSNQFGIVNLNIGSGTPILNSFVSIDWSTGIYFLKIEVDPNGGTAYEPIGDPVQLLSVPYALYSNKTNTNGKFEINETSQQTSDSALFEVKDKNGNVVFAVYEGGAELNINPAAKGAKGGFVVGGRTIT
jgi:hypothetical protein